jgi:hypothetical protein
MAAHKVLELRGPAEADAAFTYRLSHQRVFQCGPERVASVDTNVEWLLRIAKSRRGPIHKFCEIVKERGFHLIFSGRLCLGMESRRVHDRVPNQKEGECEAQAHRR